MDNKKKKQTQKKGTRPGRIADNRTDKTLYYRSGGRLHRTVTKKEKNKFCEDNPDLEVLDETEVSAEEVQGMEDQQMMEENMKVNMPFMFEAVNKIMDWVDGDADCGASQGLKTFASSWVQRRIDG